MIRHYFKSAIRNILRQKLFSAINIIGLSISLAASFLILLYVIHEFSYDRQHKNRKNIYRVIKSVEQEGKIINTAETIRTIGPELKEKFPEIKLQTRIVDFSRMYYDGVSIHGEKGDISVWNFFMLDSSFFNIFTIPILSGNINLLYHNLNSVLISKSLAVKYFGHKEVVGETLEFTYQGGGNSFTIAGVYEDLNHSSSVHANIIGNIEYVENMFKEKDKYPWAETYILTNKDIDINSLNQKINEFVNETELQNKTSYNLQPLNNIYFHSQHITDNYGRAQQGDLKNIYIFTIIAIAILLVASINYILMSTANAITRATEIGIRKTLGASRKNLFGLVFVESLTISIIAFFTAIVLTEIFLPVANQIFAKELHIDYAKNWQFIIGMVLISLFVTFISGIYTSIYLSKYEAIKVLKKQLVQFNQKTIFRKTLIIFQLFILIILIISTCTISKQINFVQNKDRGFNPKNLISINAHLIKRNEVFLNEIKTCPYIISAAGSYGGISSLFGFPEIKISVLSKPNEIKTIKCMNVWGDYFKTAEIQFIAGRDFITGSDSKSLILNETAIKILGITNPLGEYVLLNNVSYKIIGVVKDFNMYSSYTQIPALVFKNDKTISNILIRANSENTQKVIDFVEKKWDEIYDEYSGRFHYIFPEQSALDYYSSEQNFGKTIQTFAILSIIIASLGLFGLSTFLAKQKTKEIGIRKIFGSSVYSIIKTISKDFFILTIIANLMAWPLSWYLMSLWLQNFAYTINMPLEIFIITALSTLIFVMVILFINTYKTAYLNPINAIKYE